jgi:hypothetical protein
MNDFENKRVGQLDLETLCTPTNLWPWCWVPAPDEIHPEGVLHFRRESVSLQVEPEFVGYSSHHFKRLSYPCCNDGVLYEGIRTYYVNTFTSF